MKAILDFDLPEDGVEHLTAVHAMSLKILIDEFGEKIRSLDKYTEEQSILISTLKTEFWEMVNDSPASELFR